MWTFLDANKIIWLFFFFVSFLQGQFLSLIGCFLCPLWLYIHFSFFTFFSEKANTWDKWPLNKKKNFCVYSEGVTLQRAAVSFIDYPTHPPWRWRSLSSLPLPVFCQRPAACRTMRSARRSAESLKPWVLDSFGVAEPSKCPDVVARGQTEGQKFLFLTPEIRSQGPKVLIRLTPQSPVSRGRHMRKVQRIVMNERKTNKQTNRMNPVLLYKCNE